MINVTKDVLQELTAMKEIGMRVPAKVLKFVKNEANVEMINKYYENGMRTSEIADLLIDLV